MVMQGLKALVVFFWNPWMARTFIGPLSEDVLFNNGARFDFVFSFFSCVYPLLAVFDVEDT